jgi:hypothetical protein
MLKLLAVAALLLLADDQATSQNPSAAKRPNADDRRLAEKWLAHRARVENGFQSIAERIEADALRDSGHVPTMQDPNRAPPLDFPLTTGAIGRLHGGCFKILQRLGDKEARVDIYRPMTEQELRQYLGESFRNTPRLDTADVFLSNYDVSGMADDQQCKSDRCFIITKTKTYTTASGATRTIFVMEPFDSSVAESIFTKAVQEEHDTENKIRAERLAEAAKKDRERIAAEQRAKMQHDRDVKRKHYPTLLKNARNLIKAKVYAGAEKMLREIIEQVPGSDTAKEAQKELDALPPH